MYRWVDVCGAVDAADPHWVHVCWVELSCEWFGFVVSGGSGGVVFVVDVVCAVDAVVVDGGV